MKFLFWFPQNLLCSIVLWCWYCFTKWLRKIIGVDYLLWCWDFFKLIHQPVTLFYIVILLSHLIIVVPIVKETQPLAESNALESNEKDKTMKAPTKPIRASVSFLDLMKTHKENFIIISQKDKSAYLQLTLSDIIGFFSIPVCTREDGRTKCKYNCDCAKSLEIGMQIYDKGGVQNFHQFGNFVIGCVIEQQTDPLTRVTIQFEKYFTFYKSFF